MPAANLWMTEASPPGFSFKDDMAKPSGLNPPDNGTAIRVVEFPPTDPAIETKLDPNFMMKVVGDHAPARGLPVKHPLMHRTRTVDYAVILAGEIDMMLDDTVVHVKAGDVVIQQATNHAWINRGTQPCRVLFVLMDLSSHKAIKWNRHACWVCSAGVRKRKNAAALAARSNTRSDFGETAALAVFLFAVRCRLLAPFDMLRRRTTSVAIGA